MHLLSRAKSAGPEIYEAMVANQTCGGQRTCLGKRSLVTRLPAVAASAEEFAFTVREYCEKLKVDSDVGKLNKDAFVLFCCCQVAKLRFLKLQMSTWQLPIKHPQRAPQSLHAEGGQVVMRG